MVAGALLAARIMRVLSLGIVIASATVAFGAKRTCRERRPDRS
jgi:hypothetical protein